MTFVMEPAPQRQLVVLSDDPTKVAELVDALRAKDASGMLNLEPFEDAAVGAVVGESEGAVFHQRDTKKSRKQVSGSGGRGRAGGDGSSTA